MFLPENRVCFGVFSCLVVSHAHDLVQPTRKNTPLSQQEQLNTKGSQTNMTRKRKISLFSQNPSWSIYYVAV